MTAYTFNSNATQDAALATALANYNALNPSNPIADVAHFLMFLVTNDISSFINAYQTTTVNLTAIQVNTIGSKFGVALGKLSSGAYDFPTALASIAQAIAANPVPPA